MDNKKLAFTRVIEHPYPQKRELNFFAVDINSGKENLLGSSHGVLHRPVGWSSDSKFLYYYLGDKAKLYKVDVGKTEEMELVYDASEPDFLADAIFSPEGTNILFLIPKGLKNLEILKKVVYGYMI